VSSRSHYSDKPKAGHQSLLPPTEKTFLTLSNPFSFVVLHFQTLLRDTNSEPDMPFILTYRKICLTIKEVHVRADRNSSPTNVLNATKTTRRDILSFAILMIFSYISPYISSQYIHASSKIRSNSSPLIFLLNLTTSQNQVNFPGNSRDWFQRLSSFKRLLIFVY
jgi:hypothetical protein